MKNSFPVPIPAKVSAHSCNENGQTSAHSCTLTSAHMGIISYISGGYA